jgi:hypothetical protein
MRLATKYLEAQPVKPAYKQTGDRFESSLLRVSFSGFDWQVIRCGATDLQVTWMWLAGESWWKQVVIST